MTTAKRIQLCLLLPVVSLLGCHTRPRTIAVIPRTCGTLLWEPLHAGAVTQARAEGLRVYWNAPTQDDDVQKQIGFVHLSSERNYHGLILAPDETHALRTPIARVLEENIPVVIIDDDLGLRAGSKLAYVENDETAGGQLAARRIAYRLKSKGSIAVIGLNSHLRCMQKRSLSFEKTLATEAPDVKIVAREFGSSNLLFEQETTERVLRTHPEVNAIVAFSAVSTQGAYYAKIGLPAKPGIVIVGFDQDLLPPIQAGEIDSVVMQRTYQIGLSAMKVMSAMLRSEPVPARTSIAPVLLTQEAIDTPLFQEQRSYVNFPWGSE